jgi:hypothetical protein
MPPTKKAKQMTIAKGRALLANQNASADELNQSIAALEWEWKYIRNAIEIGLREEASGLENIQEIKELINQLKQRL